MNRPFVFILVVLCTSLVSGCKSTEKNPESTKSAPKELIIDDSCPNLSIEQELYAQINPEGIKIQESKIEENTLYLKVQFSGCPSDELTIAWNGLLKKSYPGKASFKVGLVETGMCEAIQIRELCVNVHALASNKKVVIYLNDVSEGLLYDVSGN
jgi:hypothetical protein